MSSTNDELIKKLKAKERELQAQQRDKIVEVLKLKRFKEGLEKLQQLNPMKPSKM